MIDNVLTLISAIRDRSNRFIVERMKQQGLHGLVPSHGTILYNLFIQKEMSMTDLSRVTGKDKSTVTALVNKLLAMGYVTRKRDPEDLRSYCVSLTPKGAAMEKDFFQISEDLMAIIYNGVSAEEQKLLITLLNRIKDNF
jgi:DNA-binding MarR family transcriptional regulator